VVGLLAVMVNRKNLTDEQCLRLKNFLLEHLANDELPRGILKAASVQFSVTHHTCSRLRKGWHAACAGLKWRMGCDIGKEGFWPWP
jgi:hypothetical protein